MFIIEINLNSVCNTILMNSMSLYIMNFLLNAFLNLYTQGLLTKQSHIFLSSMKIAWSAKINYISFRILTWMAPAQNNNMVNQMDLDFCLK